MRTRLLLLVLALTFAGVTVAEEAAPATGVAAVAVQPLEGGAPGISVEPVEVERELVVGGDIEAVAWYCVHCLMLPDDCLSEEWLGRRCSGGSFVCTCSYCEGFFSCYEGF